MTHLTLGFALAEKGDLDGAIAEHREAIRLDPEDAWVRFSLGLLLLEEEDVAGAIAEFLKVLGTPLLVLIAVLVAAFLLFLPRKGRTKRRTQH